MAAALLVISITVVNFLYVLTQVAVAVEGVGVIDGLRAVARFIRAELRELTAVFLVVAALVIAATLASALAWSGVGLIAFVPLVGLAVFPLQLAALVVRGLYRHVRNPMYLGVLLVILGWAITFWSRPVLVYGVGVAVLFHLVVVLVEEPLLRHRFGGAYDDYCRTVRRWVPR